MVVSCSWLLSWIHGKLLACHLFSFRFLAARLWRVFQHSPIGWDRLGQFNYGEIQATWINKNGIQCFWNLNSLGCQSWPCISCVSNHDPSIWRRDRWEQTSDIGAHSHQHGCRTVAIISILILNGSQRDIKQPRIKCKCQNGETNTNMMAWLTNLQIYNHNQCGQMCSRVSSFLHSGCGNQQILPISSMWSGSGFVACAHQRKWSKNTTHIFILFHISICIIMYT